MSSLPRIANRLVLGLGVTLALASCSKEPARAPAPAPAPAAEPAQTTAARGQAPGMMAEPPAAPGDGEIAGTVVETMRAGGYTYAKIDRGGKDQVWTAGPETDLAVGAKIAKVSGTLMTGFHSDTLKRTFDQIYFVGSYTVAGGAMANSHGAGVAAAAPAGGAMANPHGAAVVPAAAAVEKIAPIAGGKTVAEVFAGKQALAGKPVAVHGKVVKVNDGILGKNWLHLQDGTGEAGGNDLIVTTSATVAKGTVVVARGTVVVDKDFGAGYSYKVLVEDATIADK